MKQHENSLRKLTGRHLGRFFQTPVADGCKETIVRNMKIRASSRREFMRLSGLAVGAAGLALPTVAGAAATITPGASQPISQRDSGAILAQLVEGNKRFVKGELTHPGRRPEDFAPLAEGQAPLAIIVGCADSRVAPN